MGLKEIVEKLKEGATTPQSLQSTDSSQSMSPNDGTSYPDVESKFSFTEGVTDKTPFLCKHCNKAFAKKNLLKRHELVHTEIMLFNCNYCYWSFKHKRSRDRHHKLHTGEKKYMCSTCNSCFSRSDHLSAHMKKHDKRRPYSCQNCKMYFQTNASLTSHIQSHKRRTVGNSHERPVQRRFRCLQCTKTFDLASELKAHCLTHNQETGRRRGKKFQCSFCESSFPNDNGLKVHVQKIHSLETQGKCPTCLVKFDSLEELQKHKKVHEDSPVPSKFLCNLCGDPEFSTLDLLQKHIQETHELMRSSMGSSTAASSSSPWSNPRTTPDTLNQKRHSPTISVTQCLLCTMRFDNARDLTQHIAISHGDLSKINLSGFPIDKYSRPILYKHLDGYQVDQHSVLPFRNSQDKRRSSSPRQNPPSDVFNNDVLYPSPYPAFTGPLLCNQCPQSFENFESFKEHQKCVHLISSTTTTSHSCPECNLKFPTQENLDQHMTRHYLSTSIEYVCQNCHKTYIEPDQLQKHFFETHAQQLHRCSVCDLVYEDKIDLQKHFTSKHIDQRDSFTCNICSLVFRSETESLFHVKKFHLEKKFRCIFCNLTFKSQTELQNHCLTHRIFPCRFCGEEFNIEFLLDKHIQERHPEGISQSVTPNEGDLVQNLCTKLREAYNSVSTKQLRCNVCDTSFPAESSLNVHRRQVHNIRTSGSQKPGQTTLSLSCAYCNETCRSRTELENHMKTHRVSPSRHKCSVCDEICPSAATLSEHKLEHCKGVINDACVVCHTAIKSEEHFHAHLQQHNSQGLPASCVICRQTLSEFDIQVHAKFHLKYIGSLHPCCVCRRKYIKDELVVLGKAVSQTYMCKDCYYINKFRCNECNIKCENVLELEKHKSSHKTKCRCIICQQEFDTEAEIRAHVNIHVQQNGMNHLCHLCMKIFDSPAKLQCHLIQHSFKGSSGYGCQLCGSVFPEPALIQKHMLDHSLNHRPFDCSLCPQKFFFKAELDNHYFSHTPDQGTSNVQDFLLSKRFEATSKSSIQGSNERKCPLSPEELNSMQKHQFKEHTASEMQNCKKYFCPVCNATFPCISTLMKHEREHAYDEIFTCSECKEEFPKAEQLAIHVQTHNGDKSYKGETRKKTSIRKENRKIYMKSRIEEKRLRLALDKTFVRKSHATEPMKVHISSTTHPCELCEDNFPTSAEHKKHLEEVHNVIFACSCSVCSERFDSSEALNQHLLENHKVETNRDDSADDDLSKSSLGLISISNDLKDSDSSIGNSNMEESDARDSPFTMEESSSHLENHIPTPQTVA